jgi:hypothetical protein
MEYISGPESEKKVIFGIIAGIVLIVVSVVGISIATSFGNRILQVLNNTGLTIPASANYVAPIESVPSLALLILSTVSILVGVIMIIAALPKLYDNLTA